MSLLTNEIERSQKLVFVDYGQLNVEKEYSSAVNHCKRFALQQPVRINMAGYGQVITSGLTDRNKHIIDEAFLPGRNMLLLLTASSYAVQNDCSAVSIGLLDERTVLFPDQTDDFLASAEHTITKALGKSIEIIAPLRAFTKQDVINMAKEKGISNTYSCHSGKQDPCGKCISCKEFTI